MNPLTELAQGPSPILDRDQVEHLFGPITQVCHYVLHGVAFRAGYCNCLVFIDENFIDQIDGQYGKVQIDGQLDKYLFSVS